VYSTPPSSRKESLYLTQLTFCVLNFEKQRMKSIRLATNRILFPSFVMSAESLIGLLERTLNLTWTNVHVFFVSFFSF